MADFSNFLARCSHNSAHPLERTISLDSEGSHHTSQVTIGEAAKDTPLRQPIDVVSRTRFSGIVQYLIMHACHSTGFGVAACLALLLRCHTYTLLFLHLPLAHTPHQFAVHWVLLTALKQLPPSMDAGTV